MKRNHPFRRDPITGKDFFLCEWNNVFDAKGQRNEDIKSRCAKLPGVIHHRWSHLPKHEPGVKNKLVVWVDREQIETFKGAIAAREFPFTIFKDGEGGSFPAKKKKKEEETQ